MFPYLITLALLLLLVEFVDDDNAPSMQVCRAIVSQCYNKQVLDKMTVDDLRQSDKLRPLKEFQEFQVAVSHRLDTMEAQITPVNGNVAAINHRLDTMEAQLTTLNRNFDEFMSTFRANIAKR